MIQNPILPGFYPDPSICRVGEEYYLVCSSFELCPGIPIFHSRDLAHWEQIGHVMTEENGFIVSPNTYNGGVMAPTIRYWEGTFYVINANFDDRGNYIVTAKDPAGPWSKPHYLGDDVPGIDASLFFDHDGSCYVVGTGLVAQTPEGLKERCIWAAEFDIETMHTKSEARPIWNSALRAAASPESPHIYHIGDWYYLMIAEGGTEHYHAITMARSRTPLGWYEGNPANPVLTHRHMGYSCPVINIGHGDLVDTPSGAWGCVFLGSRLIDGNHKNMGRETFYCPVVWEREWAVFTPQTGRVERLYPSPLPEAPVPEKPGRIDFDAPALPPELCMWGVPYRPFMRLRQSHLELRCLRRAIDRPVRSFRDPANRRQDPGEVVSLIGRRQTAKNFEASCLLRFLPEGSNTAGLAIMQAYNHQLRLERALVGGQQKLRLVQVTNEIQGLPYLPQFQTNQTAKVLAQVDWAAENVVLALKARGQEHRFFYGASEDTLRELCTADASVLNPEVVGGMVGTLIALFASGNGTDSEQYARFDWFSYHSDQ